MKHNPKRTTIISPQDRLLLLIENLKEYAIIILDKKGKIIDWNKGAHHVFGFLEKEVLGKNFAIFFIPQDRKDKRSEKELIKAKAEGRAEDENWLLRKDGKRFWASGSTVPIMDKIGNHVGFAKIVRDLTDRQEIEQQRNDFISIASHELRTPLTVVMLHRQLLKKYLEKLGDQKALQHFEKISEAITHLEHMIRDLLNISKIETGNIDYQKEQLNIDLVIKDMIKELQQTTRHIIRFRSIGKAYIWGFRPQVEEVITNLLTNAIKYSPNQKTILVQAKKKHTQIVISVQDFGMGIDKESMKKIFDRFYRTKHSKAKRLPGVGLGLYIVKKIMEQHKGKVWAQSTLNKGSTFYVSFPAYTEGDRT